jgi:hypothetical protein
MAVIFTHLLVTAVHAVAHAQLALWPDALEGAFIAVFIYAAPAGAALLLWRGRTRAGLGVLAASMLGSLAFATHHHFIAVSPDHVAHLPPGSWQAPFIVTAYLSAPVDALGAALGLYGFARRS